MESEDDDDILGVMESLDDSAFKIFNDPLSTSTTNNNVPPPQQSHLDCLKEYFGHSNFRANQWQIIRSLMEDRRDNCVVMATGYGKSLCYQFPSVYLNTITIVISPLISLMEDQVLALTIANISACLLGSAQTNKDIESEILNGVYRLVYVSPEYLSGSGLELMRNLGTSITLIAIDEAHCLSQWGHDFRPCYRALGNIRVALPSIPILAVTATATSRVRDDISVNLQLRQPQHLCTGFDRPNLELIVRKKSKSVWLDLSPFVTTHAPGSIIVYALTRKESESIAEDLQLHSVRCEAYHAGLTMKKRKSIHEQFVRDKLQIIVATVAFGMGIDKPDVRFVIHYGASKDIESYYQEVGRAGRDGQPSKCVMFYSTGDFYFHKRQRNSNLCNSLQAQKDELLEKMQTYVRSLVCRRLQILQYFEGGQATCTPRLDCCDNCRRQQHAPSQAQFEELDTEGRFDFGKDASALLQVFDVFKGFTGVAKPLAVIRGSVTQVVKKYHHHALFGIGKYKSEEYWRALVELLEEKKFLCRHMVQSPYHSFPYPTIKLTSKANEWMMAKSKTLLLQPPANMWKFLRKKCVAALYDPADGASSSIAATAFPSVHTKRNNEDLRQALFLCRTDLAGQYDVMPYMIASNQALDQLASIQPLNMNELRVAKIDGLADSKVLKFGPVFLKCILKHKNLLPGSVTLGMAGSMQSLLDLHPMDNVKISTSAEHVLEMIKQKQSNTEICATLGLNESSMCNIVVALIKSGYEVRRADLQRLFDVTDGLFRQIAAIIPTNYSLLSTLLKPLKEQLPDHITYDQIKAVLAYQQVRYHLKYLNLTFNDPDATEQPSTSATLTGAKTSCDDWENCDELFADINIPTDGVVSEKSSCSIDIEDDYIMQQINLDEETRKENERAVTENIEQIDFEQEIRAEMLEGESSQFFCANISELARQEVERKEEEEILRLIDLEETVFQHDTKMEAKTASSFSAPSQSIAAKPRAIIKPNSQVRYDTDSEDEENGIAVAPPAAVAKRKLPSWFETDKPVTKTAPRLNYRNLF